MNRAERRRQAKSSKGNSGGMIKSRAKVYLGEEIMALRTKAVRNAYPNFMAAFLVATYDDDFFEWRHYKNKMGKLDRLERRIRKRCLEIPDIADYDTVRDLVREAETKVGITISMGTMTQTNMNRPTMVGKKFTYDAKAMQNLEVEAIASSTIIFFAIFLLEIHAMTGFVSEEDGNTAINSLVDRCWSNIDSIGDYYAQLEYEDFWKELQDVAGMKLVSLEEETT